MPRRSGGQNSQARKGHVRLTRSYRGVRSMMATDKRVAMAPTKIKGEFLPKSLREVLKKQKEEEEAFNNGFRPKPRGPSKPTDLGLAAIEKDIRRQEQKVLERREAKGRDVSKSKSIFDVLPPSAIDKRKERNQKRNERANKKNKPKEKENADDFAHLRDVVPFGQQAEAPPTFTSTPKLKGKQQVLKRLREAEEGDQSAKKRKVSDGGTASTEQEEHTAYLQKLKDKIDASHRAAQERRKRAELLRDRAAAGLQYQQADYAQTVL